MRAPAERFALLVNVALAKMAFSARLQIHTKTKPFFSIAAQEVLQTSSLNLAPNWASMSQMQTTPHSTPH